MPLNPLKIKYFHTQNIMLIINSTAITTILSDKEKTRFPLKPHISFNSHQENCVFFQREVYQIAKLISNPYINKYKMQILIKTPNEWICTKEVVKFIILCTISNYPSIQCQDQRLVIKRWKRFDAFTCHGLFNIIIKENIFCHQMSNPMLPSANELPFKIPIVITKHTLPSVSYTPKPNVKQLLD